MHRIHVLLSFLLLAPSMLAQTNPPAALKK